MARVLVVEDDEAVRDFVCRVLSMHGHSLLTAHDGAEAVEQMNAHHFDLLISDIAMPVMDGISLALKVRASRPHVPIILMTGYANERQRAHNLSLLIEGLLSKPFTMDQLLSEVGNALKAARARKAEMEAAGAPISAQSPESQDGISSSDSNSSSD
ncbi:MULTISPECIES: response regulator [Kordiimonas]|uniref:Response regulator receiver domain-containing protein n=1 Tax=Kordiimonas lacus TaxID=637679 RepID=A0A1G6XTE2_9PROT|nr:MULTISPECIES: response regulator [Kordiimonas]SDD80695.1 Response regulator receiver domain-containing protein [Kordiimonas lacus]